MKIFFSKYQFLICCLLFFTVLAVSSCKQEEVDFRQNNCKKSPPFLITLGFDPKTSFFSTTDSRHIGLFLQQSSQPGNPNAYIVKSYQHPSWTKGGWLAPLLIDDNGNCYTAPAPFINILNNPITNNNTIYKVDARTGEMNEFLKLPHSDSINTDNPYGIIAMTYLCETHTLYVSTVAGSKRYEQNGHIYAIDVKDAKIIDELSGIDAMGLGITYITGARELFFGTGRSSDIYSVTLDNKGKFLRSIKKAFSLEGLGPRGDDKARRIDTDPNGNLIIRGFEFNFNLIAPREKQEKIYQFIYYNEEKNWALKQ
ncbi:MAG: hypothetical protein JST23_08895 [Bacteroidetes bacterium]|nr:hypothetical protein [Bacteroidota bacterium]